MDSGGLQENDLDTLQEVEKFYSDFEVSGNPVYQNYSDFEVSGNPVYQNF